MTALADALRTIGLAHTTAGLDDLVALATKRRWSVTQLLEHIAESRRDDEAAAKRQAA
jgi:predicted DNA-binding ribbon-helix-helix protein